jgi:plastocyanin
MDRFSPIRKFKFSTIAGALALTLVTVITPTRQAFSDTVFVPAERQNQDPQRGPVEQFPESRFGAPPVRVTTGTESHFASRAVNEMETSERYRGEEDTVSAEGSGSRSPASLDFSSGHLVRRQHSDPPARDLAPVVYSQNSVAETPSSAIARRGVQEVALIASDLGFFPRTVFVSRDVPVRLFVTGASKNTLCIMMDSFQVRKQVRSQKIEEITFTPATPGKFRFYCPVNGMEGTLIVKEFSSGAPGGTSAASPERSVARVSNPE